MGILTHPRLINLSLHRETKSTREGNFAHASIVSVSLPTDALLAIRESRAKLDSLHGKVLDLTPRLRDLCWSIDAAVATNRDDRENS